MTSNEQRESESLPFSAPCKMLPVNAPISWTKLAWQDLRQAPAQSRSYVPILVLCSYLIVYLAITSANLVVSLALMSGFIFLGPVPAMACHDISLQLQKGQTSRVGHSMRESLRRIGNEMVFAVMLLIVFLVWTRAASMPHVFFPALARPGLA